jgi:hypothetical protein
MISAAQGASGVFSGLFGGYLEGGCNYAQNTYMAMGYINSPTVSTTTKNEMMRITDSGRIGIGTSAPTQVLHVNGDGARIRIDSTTANNSVLELKTKTNISYLFTDQSGHLQIYPNTTSLNVLLQPAGGNVGIGAANPMYKTQIVLASNSDPGTANVFALTTADSSTQSQRLYMGLVDNGGTGTNSYSWISASRYGYAYNTLALQPGGGSVGIGTTNPATTLQIYNSSNPKIFLNGGAYNGFVSLAVSSAALDFGFDTTSISGSTTGGIIRFFPNGSESVRIANNGNVGIGTNNPIYKLQVNGTFTCSNPIFSVTRSGAYSAATGVNTRVPYNVVDFDTNSGWNNTSYQYKPSVAGYYHFTWGVLIDVATAGNTGEFFSAIYKNGAIHIWGCDIAAATNHYSFSNGSCIIYLNGSTDYVEIYMYQYTGAAVNMEPSNGAFPMRFTGYMLRS